MITEPNIYLKSKCWHKKYKKKNQNKIYTETIANNIKISNKLLINILFL